MCAMQMIYEITFKTIFILFILFQQIVKMAKKLKKEKVSVDIVNFGEEVITYCSGIDDNLSHTASLSRLIILIIYINCLFVSETQVPIDAVIITHSFNFL